jgi:hypothetical protein
MQPAFGRRDAAALPPAPLGGAAARVRMATLIRSVSRRLERLEERATAANARESFCCRVHLVHPEKGLTGILVLESNKRTIHLEGPGTIPDVVKMASEIGTDISY